MIDTDHLFKLRMPRELLAQIGERAKVSRRSKTQEILVAVEAHLARGEQAARPETGGAQTTGTGS